MKILRLRAYYDPEKTAGIHLDHDLCKAFEDNKITYYTYTPIPTRGVSKEVRNEYKNKKKEKLYGGYVIINRFPLIEERHNPIQRAFRYLLCNIKEYILGCRATNIDVVYSSSTPPTQGAVSALVAKRLTKKYNRKVPFIYNLQDVFPDSLVNSGMTKKGSILWRVGRKIEDYTYLHADRIIVISEGFKKNIMKKGVPANKIIVVPNWVDLKAVKPVDKQENTLFEELEIDRSKFIVVYAGNLGEAQGAEVILDAAKCLMDLKDIHFVIFGGGSRFQEIADRVKTENLYNVYVTELQPQERVSEVYSMGDVALITCKPGTGNAGLPSKTWSIMACNTPIIASFDTNSDLAEIIQESGAGSCVKPGNVSELVTAIMFAYRNRVYDISRNNLREFALKHADKDVCVQKYIEVFMSQIS